MAKKNLAKLAKKTTSTRKPAVAKKTPPTKKSVEEKKLTQEEERDLKAKETVKKLLEDSPITKIDKDDDVSEGSKETDNNNNNDTPKGVDWLEEQITTLTSELDRVKSEYDALNNDYHRLNDRFSDGGDNDVDSGVIRLFNEIQENHIKLGVNDNGIGNFRIYCPGFLNRMISFFPYLENYKKY